MPLSQLDPWSVAYVADLLMSKHVKMTGIRYSPQPPSEHVGWLRYSKAGWFMMDINGVNTLINGQNIESIIEVPAP